MNRCSSTVSYADATTHKDGEIVSAGAGLWVTESDPSNVSIKIPITTAQTCQGAEVIAALHAAQTTHRVSDLRLESTRNFVAVSMTKNLPKWEDNGWIGVANAAPIQALAAELSQRKGKTTFVLTKGTWGGLEAAALARAGERKSLDDSVYLKTHTGTLLPGARLSKMTQSLA